MSAKRDYYEVLGISKDTQINEIKSQYRKLALKFHPDRNKSSEAAEHFKEISEAYAVLSDTKKRQLYDQHGHAGVDGRYSTEDIFRGAGFNFDDVGSIFENLFGGRGQGFGGFGRQRGSDLLHETFVSLEDVLNGKRMDLDLQKNVDCPECNGSGCFPGSSKTFVGQSFTTEIGFQGETDYLIRTLKGCILNTFGITASIGDVVKCTGDVVFGKEDTPSNASGDFSDDATEDSQPFTFANGQFSLNGVIQTQIQDVDINFAQNGDLLYQLGSNQSVAGIKKTLDITGRFKVALKDKTAINTLIAQLKGANFKETWGDKNAGSPEFELHFTNGVVGNGERKITIIGKGLGIADHNTTGLEPVEPIFEEINWQIKSAKIVVVNSE